MVELEILLVAFGTFGVSDTVALNNIKDLVSLGSFIVNYLYLNKITTIIGYFFRYLDGKQLDSLVKNLLKFVFLKINKINLKKN